MPPGTRFAGRIQVYDFARHRVQRAHAVGRTGASVLQALGDRLAGVDGLSWAATGLAAAWQWSRFADFRLVTVFVSRPVGSLEALGLRPVDRGENVWLVAPRDEGVFYGAETVDGVRCAHPVQVYLDLLGQPERSKEAAEALRRDHLPWSAP